MGQTPEPRPQGPLPFRDLALKFSFTVMFFQYPHCRPISVMAEDPGLWRSLPPPQPCKNMAPRDSKMWHSPVSKQDLSLIRAEMDMGFK